MNQDRSVTSDPVAWLQKLSLGTPQELEPYTIYPLCAEEAAPAEPGLLLTHQAMEAQLLEVLEKGDGEVQELEALNKGDLPVVILEGDTLVGCKQNRVVARSVILGKGKRTPIPVGCMEQGRWAWKSGRFGSGTMRIKPSVRSASTREVLEAKKRRARKASLDQRRLWRDVACCLEVSEVSSATSDYQAYVQECGDGARERARVLERQPGQVGVLVMAGGTFLGLELVGHPGTWDELAVRTLPALLMDRDWAPTGSAAPEAEPADAAGWLGRILNSSVALNPGLGQGQEINVEDDAFTGSGLWHEQQVVHLAVFAN
jgi:hypothetical protein